jgi:5-methyltetrahydropteroyltriglutamate--homocysteine methyltransferase
LSWSLKEFQADTLFRFNSGDFTLYDHVLDFNYTFNIIPSRFAKADVSDLDRYFAMGRGRQVGDVDLEAQEMQKWFDSN